MSAMTETQQMIFAPDRVYSVRGVATALDTGRQTVDRAIKRGELRASVVNQRGDTRILGSWVLDWLERQAAR